MSWTEILTTAGVAVLSSGAVASVAIHFVKRGLDKALDLRFEKLLEQSRQEVIEQFRRKASLYDTQALVYQKLLSNIYRLRNISRELQGIGTFNNEYKELTLKYANYAKELEELIFENRVILPEEIFRNVHLARHHARDLSRLCSLPSATQKGNAGIRKVEIKKGIERAFTELDAIYEALVPIMQTKIGIPQ